MLSYHTLHGIIFIKILAGPVMFLLSESISPPVYWKPSCPPNFCKISCPIFNFFTRCATMRHMGVLMYSTLGKMEFLVSVLWNYSVFTAI